MSHHLAQINVATLLAPLDDPASHGFRDNLDRINMLGESQPGFVWRAVGDGFDSATPAGLHDPLLLINLTVWESVEALTAFAYRTDHRAFVRGRHQWFAPMDEAYLALWWEPVGRRPTMTEAFARLDHLRAHGPTEHAFDFKTRFGAPSALAFRAEAS